MNKKITDLELKRVMVEIAQLFPEIDPADDGWREFMRDFIAARPEVAIDEEFSRALRAEIILRAGELDAGRRRPSRWVSMVSMFFVGAATCALVVVPILTVKVNDGERGDYYVEDEMAVMPMASKMAVRDFARPDEDMVVEEHLNVAAGTLNSRMGSPEMAMMAEPMMYDGGMALDGEDFMVNSDMEMHMPPQISWDEMPSDNEILAVAIEFFDERNFVSADFDAPYIEKWWEMRDEDDFGRFEMKRPRFAPDRVGVVFRGRDGGEVRIDVGMRNLNVLWMSFDGSRR